MTNVDEVLETLKTNRQGRRVLGVVADYLRRGYELVPRLGSVSESVFNVFVPNDDLQEDARDLLDATNNYSQVVYRALPDNDSPIDPDRKRQIGVALQQATSSFQLLVSVDAALSSNFFEDIADVLSGGLTAIVSTAARALTSDWRTVAIVGGLIYLGMKVIKP